MRFASIYADTREQRRACVAGLGQSRRGLPLPVPECMSAQMRMFAPSLSPPLDKYLARVPTAALQDTATAQGLGAVLDDCAQTFAAQVPHTGYVGLLFAVETIRFDTYYAPAERSRLEELLRHIVDLATAHPAEECLILTYSHFTFRQILEALQQDYVLPRSHGGTGPAPAVRARPWEL